MAAPAYAPAPLRCALYARISKDDRKQEKGVRQQIDDCRALVEARGWTVAAEYTDNDISAWSGAAREQYRALMDAATRGDYDAIVVLHASRLWRAAPERAADIERLGAAGVTLVAAGMELDLATSTGRMLARQIGDPDTVESDVKSERVARAYRREAERGRRASGRVAYGWTRLRVYDESGRMSWRDVEDPAEAAVVREVVARLLAGEPVIRIAADLDARGLPAPGGEGKRWSTSAVRAVARRPSNAGLVALKGQVLDVPADWPAIVTPDDHERVVALLASRAVSGRRDSSRKHLLTFGVGECGVCGAVLRAQRKRSAGRVYAQYGCNGKGCVGRSEQAVDEWVGAVIVERLSRPDARDAFEPDDDEHRAALDRVDALRARLDNAADAFAAGELTRSQVARITAKVRADLDAAEAEARAFTAAADTSAVEPLLGEQAEQVWDGLDVARRRRVLETLRVRVVIEPQKNSSGPRFDPSLVRVLWPDAP